MPTFTRHTPDNITHHLAQLQQSLDTVKPEARSLLCWKIAQLEAKLGQMQDTELSA